MVSQGHGGLNNPKALLSSPLKTREKLLDELRCVEKQVYELETNYLQETNILGNALEGFDGFLTSSKNTSKYEMSIQENLSNMDVDGSCSQPMPQPSTGTETCANSKSIKMKRKSMKARSEVWNHFTKFLNDKNENKAKCNYCDKELFCDPYKNGTASLNAHMRSCKNHPHTVETTQAQLS